MTRLPFRPAAGAYYWAGPGTVRMIRLKFFSPPIDADAMLRAYDPPALAALRRVLGATDAWVTYSWGFSDDTEREDRAYLRERLDHFRAAALRTHAYVQGTNLVRADFPHEDLWCRDPDGRRVPYHRGRDLCCPLSPRFRAIFLGRVAAAAAEDVDGVFVDNAHFGQFPLADARRASFFGCACAGCDRAFRARTGEGIPRRHLLETPLSAEYRRFRTETLEALLREAADVAHARGKVFGCNGLDAELDTRLFYGNDPYALARFQDYLLVENFGHPSRGGNAGLAPLVENAGVPVCVVSYKRVIGGHPQTTTADIADVREEAEKLGYVPCFKASEFTTDGTWHPLRTDGLLPGTRSRPVRAAKKPSVPRVPRLALAAASRWGVPLLSRVYESRRWRAGAGWILDALTMRSLPRPRLRRRP